MLKHLRLRLVYLLLGPKLKNLTIRALVQGSEIWWECTQDPQMYKQQDDYETVMIVKKEIEELSDFWTI